MGLEAYKLSIPADFSFCSLEDAWNLLKEKTGLEATGIIFSFDSDNGEILDEIWEKYGKFYGLAIGRAELDDDAWVLLNRRGMVISDGA